MRLLSGSFLLLSSELVTLAQTDPKITLTSSSPIAVKKNQTVIITCRLSGFESVASLSFEKTVFLTTERNYKESIALGTFVESLYLRTGRYSVTKHTDGLDVLYILQITGTQTVDSGTIECAAVHDTLGPMRGGINIEVYNVPEQMSINLDNPYTITEHEVLPLTCKASGVMPLPDMEVWVTDTEVAHPMGSLKQTIDQYRGKESEKWRLLTNEFIPGNELKGFCTESVASKTDCPLHFDNEIVIENRDFKPNVTHDGRWITCLMTMRDFEKDYAQGSLQLNVLHTPTIKCQLVDGMEMKVVINKTGHSITCAVKANPPVEEAENKTWTVANCNEESSESLPSDSESYGIREQDHSADRKYRKVILEFKQPVTKEYFQKTYCLRVTNAIGSASQQIKFTEAKATLSGNAIKSSIGLILAAALFLLSVF